MLHVLNILNLRKKKNSLLDFTTNRQNREKINRRALVVELVGKKRETGLRDKKASPSFQHMHLL